MYTRDIPYGHTGLIHAYTACVESNETSELLCSHTDHSHRSHLHAQSVDAIVVTMKKLRAYYTDYRQTYQVYILSPHAHIACASLGSSLRPFYAHNCHTSSSHVHVVYVY